MKQSWKTVSSKIIYSNKYFRIFEDGVKMPNQASGKYFFMHSKPALMIVPYDGKKVYMVNQYRYPLKRRLWEFPAGGLEKKNFLLQARLELKEECGITAGQWTFLGDIAPAAGRIRAQNKTYLAEKLTFGQSMLEGSEADLISKGFTVNEVKKMIKTGKIISGWTISAFYLFLLKTKQA